MKQETKELVGWIKNRLKMRLLDIKENQSQSNYEECKKNYDKAIIFLDSLPEIESHLCNGGYIQDRNGTPCCHGDKVRFKFVEKWYEDNFKEKYTPIMDGILKFCGETKKFYIQFGPNRNGYDWLDWSCSDDGCEWFEKVEG